MSLAEMLLRAAGIVRERGLYQNGYRNDAGACCMLGACLEALGAGWYLCKLTRAWQPTIPEPQDLLDLLRKAIGVGRVPDWNDAPGRTADEVIAALEKAAELAEDRL